MGIKRTFGLVKKTFREFLDDECMRLAAALSYYTIFSMPPLLILIIIIAGALLDPAQVEQALQTQMAGLVGDSGAENIRTMMQEAERPESRGVIPIVVGVGALLFGATGAFFQLQQALNTVWNVEPDPQRGGLKVMLLKRVVSLGMIVGIAFLLLVSLAVSAFVAALGESLSELLPGLSQPVLYVFNFLLSFLVITGLFAVMFKVLPDAEVKWKDVWIGAMVTAFLFVLGKLALGLYIGNAEPGSAYGAAGSLIVILVWIYYATIILLLGAEFTQVWAEQRGGGIEPADGAVRVERQKHRIRNEEDARKSQEIEDKAAKEEGREPERKA